MTLFPDGTKERLHGHNYRLAASVEFSPGNEGFLDFARVKAVLSALCLELREHLLMPDAAPEVEILRRDEDSTEMLVCGRRYVLPSDEILWLPMNNVMVETLAEYLWDRIEGELRGDLAASGVDLLEVTVTEAPGQGASHRGAPRPEGGQR
jgi:6-pyruvoyltetrahydropterin/6-carboxytetrahydropterin synthase